MKRRSGSSHVIKLGKKREEEKQMPIDEINELKDSFVKDLLPLRIYLFGSFAEGKENTDSDYDFYIVVDDSEKDVLD